MSTQPIFQSSSNNIPLIDPKLRFYTQNKHFEQNPAAQYTNERNDGYPLTRFMAKQVVTPFDTVGIITAVKLAIIGQNQVVNSINSGETGKDNENKKYFPAACLFVAGSDKSIRCYNAQTGLFEHVWHAVHGGSAVRSIAYMGSGFIISSGMDGRLVVTDMETGACAGQVKAHSRLVNAMDYSSKFGLVASGGYDGWVVVYKVVINTGSEKVELTKIGQYKFMQIPTIVKIAQLPHTGQPVVLACVQDSTYLNYLSIPNYTNVTTKELTAQFSSLSMSQPSVFGVNTDDTPLLSIISRTNLLDSVNTSSFVTFTPMSLDICPDGSNRFAVATSHSPYMRVIVGKIGLEEPEGNNPALSGTSAHGIPSAFADPSSSQSSDASSLGKESSTKENVGKASSTGVDEKKEPYGTMVLHNILAHAQQDQYSMPKVKWSQSGTGVWVSGDDGLVRGLEVETGKLVVELGGADCFEEGEEEKEKDEKVKDGASNSDEYGLSKKFTKKHTDKIRDIDVGQLPAVGDDGVAQDILVTGGVDKRVFEFFV